ncbi:MAG TPA: LysM peptidoglycan-binding domain-containing protein [Mobilitalea sp.]|nr:LysM peptidoglycan-binding domain-containing protein [Mobilitalea sp.]
MIIHVVQKGDTISSIAQKYEIDEHRLIQDNGITNYDNLAVGQTIIIVHSKQVHTVIEGDTLQGIADQYGISLIQLLRNNPYLLEREFIFPGETIVISYEDEKIRKITTNGYVLPYVEKKILEKNLLFLSYLSIFSYVVAENGDLNDIDDISVINLAKSYGVAPIMVITNLKEKGYDIEAAHNIIINQEFKNNFIENVLSVLKKKGYYAANINFPYIETADRKSFYEFITEFTEKLHNEGFKVIMTITPNTFELDSGNSHEEVDYSFLGRTLDGIILSHYDWAYPVDISTEMIPFYHNRNLVAYFASQIPPEKIMLAAITIGYIWELPFIEEVSKVNIISYTNAVVLASEANVPILFNKLNLSSYYYLKNQSLRQVTFYDARGFKTYVHLIPDFNLQGLGIWNVMYDIQQTFFLINTQYDIENSIQ